MGLFNKVNREIKGAKLLGVREAHETMIFSTVNFTLYSFWVEYADGSTQVVECSPSNPNDHNHRERDLFETLMAFANAPEKTVINNASRVSDASILDELQKLKELHAAGVITDELFNLKKSGLIEQLTISSQEQNDDTQLSNLMIVRGNKHPRGEAQTVAFLDGMRLDSNVDDSIIRNLYVGEHSIYFMRAACSSKKIKFLVKEGKRYKIIVTPKLLSIEVQVKEE